MNELVILESLTAKPKPKKIASVNLVFENDATTFIEDQRDAYENVSYEKLIENLLGKPVGKLSVESESKSDDSDIVEQLKYNYKYIRKVPGVTIKITQSKVKINPKLYDVEESTIKSIIEGKLINTKKLPKYSKKNILNAKKQIALSYYLNNREVFTQFINSFFGKYKDELDKDEDKISCNTTKSMDDPDAGVGQDMKEFTLLTHQKVVRDYINMLTPYRGLLLYHGLGSGKTCSSIAIAEGLKSKKKILILTPKSLLRNYIEELKTCGDPLYRFNYNWSFVNVFSDKPEAPGFMKNVMDQLTSEMDLPEAYIIKNKGAWVPDYTKKPNFNKLSSLQQKAIMEQIDVMIFARYSFVSYNGLSKKNIHHQLQTFNGVKNPFDDKVIIIDEAHNFVSRIVNKIKKNDKNEPAIMLYNWLLTANNCRVVFLSGTPIINYPIEIGILFNMLRGHMHEFSIKIPPKTTLKLDKEYFVNMFKSYEINLVDDKLGKVALFDLLDMIAYKPSTRTLTLSKNPDNFINKYKKTTYNGLSFYEVRELTKKEIKMHIMECLNKNKFDVKLDNFTELNHTAFEDRRDVFDEKFVDVTNRGIANPMLFKRRIIGLTSYFRSAQEKLMPKFDKDTDLKIIRVPMSKFQLGIYEEARVKERKEDLQKSKKKKNPLYDDDESSSTYRIFSRAACNFVFPETMKRPMPNEAKATAISSNDDDDPFDPDASDVTTAIEDLQDKDYSTRIREALIELNEKSSEYLTPSALKIYSPKYGVVLANILDVSNKGNHLIYSDFKTLEGIGIMKLVLKQNGFVEFKISKKSNIWNIDMDDDDIGKPAFVSYTGSEDDDEKEIYKNIYNNVWDEGKIPVEIKTKLQEKAANNIYGDIIKIFMITSSGAEGITLRNCQNVHVMEPYWHPVRVQQVIGRARRICSHEDLPPDEQVVRVFMYLMTFSKEQIKDQLSTELLLKDKSILDKNATITTDEYMYEKSNIKEEINNGFIKLIKEASIDCNLYKSKESKDKYTCFSFNNPSVNNFLYAPSIKDEDDDVIDVDNKIKTTVNAKEVTIDGKKYAITEDYKLYNLDSYLNALQNPGEEPVYIGYLDMDAKQIVYD